MLPPGPVERAVSTFPATTTPRSGKATGPDAADCNSTEPSGLITNWDAAAVGLPANNSASDRPPIAPGSGKATSKVKVDPSGAILTRFVPGMAATVTLPPGACSRPVDTTEPPPNSHRFCPSPTAKEPQLNR